MNKEIDLESELELEQLIELAKKTNGTWLYGIGMFLVDFDKILDTLQKSYNINRPFAKRVAMYFLKSRLGSITSLYYLATTKSKQLETIITTLLQNEPRMEI